MKLERTLKQHANGVPEVIADGSKAQIIYCIADAKKDIRTLSFLINQLVGSLEDVTEWVDEEKRWADNSDLKKWADRKELLNYVVEKARKVQSSRRSEMKKTAAAIMCIGLASCGVNPNDAERVLKAQGMKDVKIEGYAFWGCASGKNGDTFASNFTATAQDGSKVTGVICSGLLKGYTVRFD